MHYLNLFLRWHSQKSFEVDIPVCTCIFIFYQHILNITVGALFVHSIQCWPWVWQPPGPPSHDHQEKPGSSVMSETFFDLAQIHELNTSLCSITFPLTCTHSMCLLFLSMEVVVGFRQSHGRQASVAVWMSGREGEGAFHRSWLGFDVMRGDGVFFLDLFYCANERVLLVVFDDGDSCG